MKMADRMNQSNQSIESSNQSSIIISDQRDDDDDDDDDDDALMLRFFCTDHTEQTTGSRKIMQYCTRSQTELVASSGLFPPCLFGI